MNDFYKQPKLFQWVEAILLLLIGLLPALVIIEKGYSQPLFYLLFLIYIPIVQFAATPFFTMTAVSFITIQLFRFLEIFQHARVANKSIAGKWGRTLKLRL